MNRSELVTAAPQPAIPILDVYVMARTALAGEGVAAPKRDDTSAFRAYSRLAPSGRAPHSP